MIKNGRLECPSCRSTDVLEMQVKTAAQGEVVTSEARAKCQMCQTSWAT